MKWLFSIAAFLFLLTSCGGSGGSNKGELQTPYTSRNWLFLIYMDADDPVLDRYWRSDIEELEQVIYNPSVKVVVLKDSLGNNGGEIYESSDLNGKLVKVKDIPEPNMGDPQTLISFVEEYAKKYPATYIALDLWDHGDGWRAISSKSTPYRFAASDSSSNDYLYMFELQSALRELKNDGINLSLIGFDSCLMGMVEVLYDIMEYAEAFVLSEDFEPIEGWNYTYIMEKLTENSVISPYGLGKAIVDAYKEEYGNSEGSYTLSVIKKEEAEELIGLVDLLASQFLNGTLHYEELLQARENASEIVGRENYVDLYSLVEGINSETAFQIKELIENLYSVIRTDENYYGISIFFPDNSSTPDLQIYFTTRENPVGEYFNPYTDRLWDELLKEFFVITGR